MPLTLAVTLLDSHSLSQGNWGISTLFVFEIMNMLESPCALLGEGPELGTAQCLGGSKCPWAALFDSKEMELQGCDQMRLPKPGQA